jgi:hypothetical protein
VRRPGHSDTTVGLAVLAAAASIAPREPGVYLFLGPSDEVVYVGKATHLSGRLRQHAGSDGPTSYLHQRYADVRRVVWEIAKSEDAAAWREADLIFALRPPFNANPGLRSYVRPPYLVVTETAASRFSFTLVPDPPATGHVYGCFPHLGKGVASRLGIACSDGYVALLRLLWSASGAAGHMPTGITKSAPSSFEVTVAAELRPALHRLLSGVGVGLVDALADAALLRPAFMQPALARDREAARRFFAAGPQLVRSRRLRHGLRTRTVDAETYRACVTAEISSTIE